MSQQSANCEHQPNQRQSTSIEQYISAHCPRDRAEETHQQILIKLLHDKDDMIKGLESQLTKFKVQHAKDIKAIQSLQDKVSQLAPNANNTGSTFMMASEFKDYFDGFMKETLSEALASLLSFPAAYQNYSRMLLSTVYSQVLEQLSGLVQRACQAFNVSPEPDNIQKIKCANLKFIQDHWETIFLNNPSLQQKIKVSLPKYNNPEIRQVEESEDFESLIQSLIKICAYMVLQEKEWKFIYHSGSGIGQFSKKEHICIDGWIKEKGRVLLILEGMEKDDTEKGSVKHQNLKNYVIPFPIDSEQMAFELQFQSLPQSEKVESQGKQNRTIGVQWECPPNGLMSNQSRNKSSSVSTEPAVILLYDDKKIKEKKQKNKSKENKLTISDNPQFRSNGQTPKHSDTGIKRAPLQQKNQNLKNNNFSAMLSPSALPKSNACKDKEKQKGGRVGVTTKGGSSKQSLISDPSFEQIINFPMGRGKQSRQKARVDQLPLRRENYSKSKQSRKSSTGKIVGQYVGENGWRKDKENSKNVCNKENNYRQMIKSKLMDECGNTKTERMGSRHSRDEDRPLRVMNMKKIRDKYLNL